MLTSDQLRIVLGSADHRRTYGLDLPDASLRTLSNDPTQFTAFYDRWTAQGQPRYEPPVAPATPAAPATPVATEAMPMPVPPMPLPVPPAPVMAQFAPYSSAMPYSPNMHNYVATPTGSRPGLAAMLIGFGIAAAGIIITIVTWEFAAPGGTFVVAWGSILFGSIRGIRGALQFSRGR